MLNGVRVDLGLESAALIKDMRLSDSSIKAKEIELRNKKEIVAVYQPDVRPLFSI
jgi:hypothetical protein